MPAYTVLRIVVLILYDFMTLYNGHSATPSGPCRSIFLLAEIKMNIRQATHHPALTGCATPGVREGVWGLPPDPHGKEPTVLSVKSRCLGAGSMAKF